MITETFHIYGGLITGNSICESKKLNLDIFIITPEAEEN